MRDQLVKFETAKLAKEKGFDGSATCESKWLVNDKTGLFKEWIGLSPYVADGCITYYRPTQSLLQKWLRDEHKKVVTINPHFYDYSGTKYNYRIYVHKDNREFDTYEQALEEGLKEALNSL